MEGLINPLQEQMEEWKRGVNTLDKDHAKGRLKKFNHIQKHKQYTVSEISLPKRYVFIISLALFTLHQAQHVTVPETSITCIKNCFSNTQFSDSQLTFITCPSEPEYKRARQEIKKKSSDTLKLQKKAKKGKKHTFHFLLNQQLA